MRYIAVFGAIILVFLLVIGSVAPDTDDDQTKIIKIVLGMHGDCVVEKSVEVRYGHPPNLGLQNGNLTVMVRAPNGTSLFSFDVWDPRYQCDTYGIRNELEQHGHMDPDVEKVYSDMGEKTIIDLPLLIPYHRDIQTIDLVDRNSGSLLISVNISPAIDSFEKRFPRDCDMMAGRQSMPPGTIPASGKQSPIPITVSFLAVILVIFLFHRIR